MPYIENPKTKGSNIVCCIPQKGTCPIKCEDCFFQSGRSYLEPLDQNLPNMPDELLPEQILRVNDGNDSNHQRDLVLSSTEKFKGRRFFNTSIPKAFDEPWVLTVNPAGLTDSNFHRLDETKVSHLMYVRFRTNLWNLELLDKCVDHYSKLNVRIVLVFMAYYTQSLPQEFQASYEYRKRTLNSYWCITHEAWAKVMERYKDNRFVSSCSGDGSIKCKDCGICIREFDYVVARKK